MLFVLAFVALNAASPGHAGQTAAPPIAQEQPATPAGKAKATVVIADATAPPDWELRVRVSLDVIEGTELGRMTMKVTYPTIFNYLRAEPGDPLKPSSVELKVEPIKVAAGADTASLEIEVLPAKGSNTIPAGPFANIVFKIDDKANPGPVRMTATDVKAWGPSPAGESIPAAADRVATITIAPGGLPIFNCFFYMH